MSYTGESKRTKLTCPEPAASSLNVAAFVGKSGPPDWNPVPNSQSLLPNSTTVVHQSGIAAASKSSNISSDKGSPAQMISGAVVS